MATNPRIFQLVIHEDAAPEILTSFTALDCAEAILILARLQIDILNGTWKEMGIEQGPHIVIPEEL